MNSVLPAPRLPRNMMLGISLAQGLGLLLLWRSLTNETWPSQTPIINFPLWTFTVAWPVLLLLSLESGNTKRVLQLASAFCGALLLLAVYIGWQASPVNKFQIVSLVSIYTVTLVIACFKALMYMQQRASNLPLTYEVLFALSWRNFLVILLAVIFLGGVQALLSLWAALFQVIGIDFFRTLFSKDWFLFPVLAVAFGIGVFVFRRLTGVIDSINRLLEGLIKLLLLLVILILALFLAALPFTGLAPLWETGRGTGVLLWLSAVTLFFVNAVYQTGRDIPYPQLVHRLLYPGIALLPIVTALALYGLYLRIDQYGWTVARCWALTITLLLGLFSCGYLWEIVRRRSAWANGLARVNIAMGCVILALMLIVNSPLLNFRSISLASQMARVEGGELEVREFDFDYAKRHLARPGFLGVRQLLEELRVSDPELAESISKSMESMRLDTVESPRDFWERVTFRPQGMEAPADLKAFIEDGLFQRPWKPEPGVGHPHRDTVASSMFKWELARQINPVFLEVDLNNDGVMEYALVSPVHAGRWVSGLCFYLEDGVWRYQDLSLAFPSRFEDIGKSEAGLLNILRHGEIEAVEPAFRDLKIGELTLRLENDR